MSKQNQPLVRPFLKWAGGKRQLIAELKNNLPTNFEQARYFEPFIGGGALFFFCQPQKAVINDRNTELINCYQVIKDQVEALIEDLEKHQNSAAYYYQIRQWDREPNFYQRSAIERASRIIYLNKTCYNGLFRVNQKGQFNVPFGRYKKPKFLEPALLNAISYYLNQSQVQILNTDFQAAVQDAKSGDFIYFDPPYDPLSGTASFTAYDKAKFDHREQERLKQTVDELSQRGCKVMVSNANTDFIRELYQDYGLNIISANRAINCNGLKRGKIEEVLIKNY